MWLARHCPAIGERQGALTKNCSSYIYGTVPIVTPAFRGLVWMEREILLEGYAWQDAVGAFDSKYGVVRQL